MHFSVLESALPTQFDVFFNEAESSIDAKPRPQGGIASVLLNYLQLEIGEDGTVLFAWGLFDARSTWRHTNSYPYAYSTGTLVAHVERPVTPGVSIRLDGNQKWTAYANLSQGWLCLGDPNASSNCRMIEFAPGTVAVLCESQLVAVWLKPINLSGARR
jgi:hypothetical protein